VSLTSGALRCQACREICAALVGSTVAPLYTRPDPLVTTFVPSGQLPPRGGKSAPVSAAGPQPSDLRARTRSRWTCTAPGPGDGDVRRTPHGAGGLKPAPWGVSRFGAARSPVPSCQPNPIPKSSVQSSANSGRFRGSQGLVFAGGAGRSSPCAAVARAWQRLLASTSPIAWNLTSNWPITGGRSARAGSACPSAVRQRLSHRRHPDRTIPDRHVVAAGLPEAVVPETGLVDGDALQQSTVDSSPCVCWVIVT
jgi:hypothetical protein